MFYYRIVDSVTNATILNILTSWVRHYRVTWRHWWRHQSTRHRH